MMLTEAEGKSLLRGALVETSLGSVVTRVEDLEKLRPTRFPLAAKAQVAAGGRGKAGGVLRCGDYAELRAAFAQIMTSTFAGERPAGVLVEPWLTIERELYLSVALDARAGGYAVLYSPTGGVDIESAEVLAEYPFGAPEDFRGHLLRETLVDIEPDVAVRENVVGLARRLVDVVVAHECTTVEINPLGVCEGALVAVDAKVVLDDSAAHRLSYTATVLDRARALETGVAADCRAANLVFVPLGGTVGLVSGGAGMTMRAMDAVAEAGGAAAGFLDVSGNPTPRGIEVALQSLDCLPGVDRVLVSIFGGGLDVGRIARSVTRVIDAGEVRHPVAFRLSGAGRENATQILADRGFHNHESLESAVAELLGRGHQ